MSSSGFSATSGSRLFWIMRNAASCGHARHERSVPRGERTIAWAGAPFVLSTVMSSFSSEAVSRQEVLDGGVPHRRGLAWRGVMGAGEHDEFSTGDPRGPLARALDRRARLVLA